MKKLLLLTGLLFSITVNSQSDRNVMFTVGVDVRNLITGSAPTNNESALDLTAGVALKTGNGGFQFGINYESFPRIGYYGLDIETGYILTYRKKWLITPQLKTILIMRSGEMVEREINNNEYIGAKLALNVKFEVLPGLYFGLDGGGTFRGDKYALIPKINESLVFDGTFEVTYKIDIN